MSKCVVCKTNKAEVPDRERMGRPIKRICHSCHAIRLIGDLMKVAEHQNDPEKNELPCIQDLVVKDIEARKLVGVERYGTVLQPFNGRSALLDAYQEALDLAVYLRQMLYEEEHKVSLQ